MTRELLVRGHVHTNDATRPRAEAVLVRGERIVAVGAFDELRDAAKAPTIIDVGDGAVLPGLVDGHAHPLMLGRSLTTVRLDDARSMAEVVTRAQRWAESNPSGWVQGRGWDETLWSDGSSPNASALDLAFPHRPVLLSRVDGHAATANRAARRAAGLGDDSSDPPGGRIVRDDRGKPTGLLVDAAMELVARAMPKPSRAELESWLLAALAEASSRGLTGVHDAGIDPDVDAAYAALASAGRLPLRVYAMADLSHASGLDLVRAGVRARANAYELRAAKLFADGALGSRGAQLFEPYSDAPCESGLALQSDDELWSLGREAAARGFQLAVHAIGDRANARALDLFERLKREGFRIDRPRLEHAQLLRVSDIPRLRALGVIASMQPVHVVTDSRFAEARVGLPRLAGAYAWRSLFEAGVRVSFGSDFPVESPDPRLGFDAAIHRAGWRMEEALDAARVLDAFTLQNAFASFREDELGRVAAGTLADLTLFATDPMTDGDFVASRVVATVVGGRVFQA